MKKILHILMMVGLAALYSFPVSAERSPHPDGYDRGYGEVLNRYIKVMVDGRVYAAQRGSFHGLAEKAMGQGPSQWDAILRLSAYGETHPDSAEEVLTKLLKNSDTQIAFPAALSLVILGKFDPEPVVEVLLERLSQGTPKEQALALRAFALVDREIADAIQSVSAEFLQTCENLSNPIDKKNCRDIAAME